MPVMTSPRPASSGHQQLLSLAEPLFAFALARSPDRDTALDAVQETLAAAVREERSWPDDEAQWAWLVAVTRNKLADAARRRGRQGATLTALGVDPAELGGAFVAGEEMPDAGMLRNEVRNVCQAALSELTPRQRNALQMFYRDGMSHGDIGARMALSGKAVESLLARSRIALHSVLKRMIARPEELL